MSQIEMFETRAVPPTVVIPSDVWSQMMAIVSTHEMEVGWFGEVERPDDKTYRVKNVFYVPQESMSAAECTISNKGDIAIQTQILNQGILEGSGEVRMWGHSHVNMQVNPSGTDVEGARKFATNIRGYVLRLILNKRGDINAAIYDWVNNIIFTNLTVVKEAEDNLAPSKITKIREALDAAGITDQQMYDNICSVIGENEAHNKMVKTIKEVIDIYGLPNGAAWDNNKQMVVGDRYEFQPYASSKGGRSGKNKSTMTLAQARNMLLAGAGQPPNMFENPPEPRMWHSSYHHE